jgi:hypothetical protein
MVKFKRYIAKLLGVETQIRKDERKRIGNDMINNSAWFNKRGNEKVSNILYIYGRLISNHTFININSVRATIDDFGDINIQLPENEPTLRKLNWGLNEIIKTKKY